MHKVTLCDIYWNIQLLYLKRLSYLVWPSFMIYTAFPGSFSYWHQSFFWLCSVAILQTTNLQGIFFHGLVDYNYHDFMDIIKGFTGGASGKEPICQCKQFKRWGFEPWAMKIPWKRACQFTPVFWPGESHGQRSLVSYSP